MNQAKQSISYKLLVGIFRIDIKETKRKFYNVRKTEKTDLLGIFLQIWKHWISDAASRISGFWVSSKSEIVEISGDSFFNFSQKNLQNSPSPSGILTWFMKFGKVIRKAVQACP